MFLNPSGNFFDDACENLYAEITTDYDAVDGITESIAKLWINNAEEFMEEAKKFL